MWMKNDKSCILTFNNDNVYNAQQTVDVKVDVLN